MGQFKFSRENKLTSPDDYGFNAPYLLACAAHRINPAHWHDLEVKQDQKIQDYVQWLQPRLSVVINEREFSEAKLDNPWAFQTKIEVVAKGKSYSHKAPHPKGGWYAAELRNTDEELAKKFADNAMRVLPSSKVNEAVENLLELEKVGNVARVIAMITP